MAFYLAPILNNSQITANGAPLSGGSITTYQAGTVTPATTYTDNTGGTPQANPITLNTQGLSSSPVWLQGGQSYKFVIKDSLGNTVRTIDTVKGTNDPSGAGINLPSDGTFSFRNRLHNGNFIINQRAVSGTVTLAAGAYGHDRWKAGAGGCTYTFATVGNSTAITISSGSLLQIVESTNVEGGVYTLVNNGTAQARYAINGGTTSGGYFTASAASPLALSSATANQTVTVEFSTGTLDRVQLEPGTAATTFERRPISVELALCQRYLPAFNGVGTTDDVGWGGAFTTSAAIICYQFLVEPRVPVTGISVNSLASFQLSMMTVGSTVTAITFTSSSRRMCRMSVTGTGAPYGANTPAVLLGQLAGAQILFTGAEL